MALSSGTRLGPYEILAPLGAGGMGEVYPACHALLQRIRIGSGRKEPWKDLIPADSAGLNTVNNPVVTPVGKVYAYNYFRVLSYLQFVEGVK